MAKDNNLDRALYIAIATILKRIRIEKGISLEELANRMDIYTTKQNLSKYENALLRINVQTFNSYCLALNENPGKVWQEINEFYYTSNFKDIKHKGDSNHWISFIYYSTFFIFALATNDILHIFVDIVNLISLLSSLRVISLFALSPILLKYTWWVP